MSLGTTRVLVLEGDTQLQSDLSAALSSQDYDVRAPDSAVNAINAIDGLDGLDGLDDLEADVLVVDLRDRSVSSVLARLGAGAADVTVAAERGMTLYGLWIDPCTHQAERDGIPLSLTATEFALLVALVTRAGAVASKGELLRELRGTASTNPNLIEAHVSSLRRKLDATGSPLIRTVRGVGYSLRRPLSP